MSFGKRHNVFSDIPGFDASKGERIVKILRKLWEKIEHIEQIRISERKSKSEEIHTSFGDDDITITDVQYKLLVLQLQYVRSILKNKHDENYASVHSKVYDEDLESCVSDKHDLKKNKYHGDSENKVISVETHAKRNLTEELNPGLDSHVFKNVERIDAQVSTDDHLFASKETHDLLSSTCKVPTSKPHYHLKLDDVPFILGASTTASHSVVANVQNIISMMKSHNRALCGPRHNVSRSVVDAHNPIRDTQAIGKYTRGAKGGIQGAMIDTQESSKMLNDLTQDLCKLTVRLQNLVETSNAGQGKNQSTNISENYQKIDGKVSTLCREKVAPIHHDKRHRSISESELKLHAEVKNFSKQKENDLVKQNMSQKQSIWNNRKHPTNLPIVARRKLLRSLQNFKTHLSAEDISWD